MKITALKSGRFAHPVVSEPQIEVVEGTEYPVDAQMGQAMIDCGWAEVATEAVSKETSPPTQAPEKPIKSAIKKTVKRKVKKGKK
jgi:hypothetical protein